MKQLKTEVFPMLRWLTCILLACPVASAAAAADVIKIDLSPENGRRDALAPGMLDWRYKTKGDVAEFDAGSGVSVRLENAGTLKTTMWKGGYGYKSPMASDGVLAGGEGIRVTIAGLPVGKHSVATFHNAAENKLGPCSVSVAAAKGEAAKVTPTFKVHEDADAASGYVEFDVKANGEPVTLQIAPADKSGTVVLNGIWIDSPNPALMAIKPSPESKDLHAPENPQLTWTAAKSATAHKVYFGSTAEAVAKADEKSPEFKGEVNTPSFAPKDTKVQGTYFWRVDEVGPSGVTKGEVWSFKVRLLAFPGAEGYGRFAQGGRGGKVYEVTTLEDYDQNQPPIPGSYRAAIEAEGPRTVVFRVSGLIKLKRPCIIKNGFVTVAGQTAPGDGICLATYSAGMGANDAIVRFLRVRVGDESKKAMDGLGLGSSNDSIIDHCSISWTMDEGTSSRGGHNITFQWNIISESLQHAYHYNAKDRTKYETHAFAGSISGDIGSYHHNLLAHNTDRNWSLAGGLNQDGKYAGRLDIRNNVVYNWTARTTDGGVADLNYVNNYYKPYPQQPHFVKWLLMLDPINDAWGKERVYMSGNVMEGFNYDRDNWAAYNQNRGERRSREELIKLVRVDKPIYPSYVKEESARDAYKRVLAGAGAILPKRDVIDTRIVEEVRTGTVHYMGKKAETWGPGHKNSPNVPGIIDTQTDVLDAKDSADAPWPHYKTANVPADTDHDGMPDAWETQHKLNPNDPTDGNADPAGDGYTNLERYLNELVEMATKTPVE
jgi:hypothetical protein